MTAVDMPSRPERPVERDASDELYPGCAIRGGAVLLVVWALVLTLVCL